MYKTKLKEWGLSKNLKAQEAVAIFRNMQERQAAGISTQLVIRGKSLSLEQMRKYMKRNKGRLEARMAMSRTMTPTVLNEADDILQPTEDLLRAVQIYVDSAFDSGKWFLAPDGVVRSSKGEKGRYKLLDLWDRMDMGSYMMTRSEQVDLLRLLSPVFGYLTDIVREECPRSLPFILGSLGVLQVRERKDLIGLFGRYLCSVSTKIFGANHPQTRVWMLITAMFNNSSGKDDYIALERLFFMLIDKLSQHTIMANGTVATASPIGVYNDYYDAILVRKDLASQEMSLRAQVQALPSPLVSSPRSDDGSDVASMMTVGPPPHSPSSESAQLLRFRHATTVKDLCLSNGDYASAEVALDGLRDWGDWDGALAFQTRADVRMRQGDLPGAEMYYREASRLIDNKSLFRDEMWISDILENLEKVLVLNGKGEEASKVRTRRERRIANLTEKSIDEETVKEVAEHHGDPRGLVAGPEEVEEEEG
jgi:hypothetical protein